MRTEVLEEMVEDENIILRISSSRKTQSENTLQELEYRIFKNKNNEDVEFHKILSTLFLNTEKYSSEDIVDFSDDRYNEKVELKRDSNEEINFIQQHDEYYFRNKLLYFLNYLDFLLFKKEPKRENKKKLEIMDVKLTSNYNFRKNIHNMSPTV